MGNLAADLRYMQALEKEACERSFAQFVRSSWHIIEPSVSLVWNWHLETICGYMEAVYFGKIQNLLVNVPPGSAKSTVVSVAYHPWVWGPMGEPHHRFLGVTNEQGLALRDALKSKAIIESEWYQEKWLLEFDKKQNEKSLYQTKERGFRQSLGVLSSGTGKRGDTLLFDDLNDTIKAESEPERTKVNDSYDLKWQNRVNDPKVSKRIMIAQRTNIDDAPGHVLQKTETKWTHLVIPAEFEEESKYRFDAGKDIGRPELNDPRREEGELYFKARFDDAWLRAQKEDLGSYGTAGQLQQRPNPKGGGLFKDEYWKYYSVLPADIDVIRIYADTASKTQEQNDYSVFQCWARSRSTGIYLLDQARGKWEAPELKRQFIAFWNKHKPTLKKPLGSQKAMVEDKSSGTALIQEVKAETNMPVGAIQRNRDKVVRAIGVVPRIEAGWVHLPAEAEWLFDYKVEYSRFSPMMTHKHDDQIDPTMDAIEDLLIFPGINYGGAL